MKHNLKEKIDRAGERVKRNGFFAFMSEQGVIGLAVGLVLGTATATLANSFINNMIMPPLGLILGSDDGLKGVVLRVATDNGEVVLLQYGAFLNDLINFAVIALVIYVVVRWMKIEIKKK
ncbi:MAG: MscL family protein [Candidatus Nomurabacteria bacterium]|jgi:large conductance mechanosensitive channel|nr:MscL family protein [Candidatus Nomurabacteria bacterium]